MRLLLEDFASDQSGATAIEYGLLVWNKLNNVAVAIK